jgi:hypothetical protein
MAAMADVYSPPSFGKRTLMDFEDGNSNMDHQYQQQQYQSHRYQQHHQHQQEEEQAREYSRSKRVRVNHDPFTHHHAAVHNNNDVSQPYYDDNEHHLQSSSNPLKRRNMIMTGGASAAEESFGSHNGIGGQSPFQPFRQPFPHSQSPLQHQHHSASSSSHLLPNNCVVAPPLINWEERFEQFKNECETIIHQKCEENKVLKRAVAVSKHFLPYLRKVHEVSNVLWC